MYTLEDQVCDNAFQSSFFRFYKVDVFRTNNYVNRFIFSETFIYAGKFCAEDLNQLVAEHNTRNNITFTDEVGNESIFRLVVDLFRSTHLLDIAFVHYDDRIGHRKGLFLVMGNVNECDSKLVFQTDQFVLHVLSELEIQSAERFIQKQKLRLVYDRSGDGDTLLLTAAEQFYTAVLISIKIYQFQCIFDFIINIIF